MAFPRATGESCGEWQFDSEAGKHEVLARRIGRNEIRVIQLCSSYGDVQKNYAGQSHDGKPAGLFAQRIRITSGHQDGLSWEKQAGRAAEPARRLGSRGARGLHKGSGRRITILGLPVPHPYRAWASVPSGKKSYIVNRDMTGGFALVRVPGEIWVQRIMTFIVNQDGKVCEKDLGPDTDTQGAGMTEYNPDDTWAPASTS